MDDVNEQEMPVEEIAEVCCEAPAEGGKSRGPGFIAGLLGGTITGAALAILLAPLRGEQDISEGNRWSREGVEQGGALRARVAADRVKAVADGIVPKVRGAWNAVRERLREAAGETKEGMAEGQAEARNRYETATKRRRPRR